MLIHMLVATGFLGAAKEQILSRQTLFKLLFVWNLLASQQLKQVWVKGVMAEILLLLAETAKSYACRNGRNWWPYSQSTQGETFQF